MVGYRMMVSEGTRNQFCKRVKNLENWLIGEKRIFTGSGFDKVSYEYIISKGQKNIAVSRYHCVSK